MTVRARVVPKVPSKKKQAGGSGSLQFCAAMLVPTAILVACIAMAVWPESAVALRSDADAPQQLNVWSKHHYIDLAGQYDILPGKMVNGMPVWKQVGGSQPEKFIFSSTKQDWVLGSRDWMVNGANTGWLRSPAHQNEWPDETSGPWRYRQTEAFAEDSGTIFCTSKTPESITVSSMQHYIDLGGVYDLVKGMTANGLPVWRQAEGDQDKALYSGKDGEWVLGFMGDAKDDVMVGWLKSPPHGGRLPHQVRGAWSHHPREKLAGWSESDTVTCTETASVPVHDEA